MAVRNWLGGSGDFEAPGNWDTGTPGTAGSASFNAGAYTVPVDTPATIDSLFGGSGAATLDIIAGGTLAVQSGYLQSSLTLIQSAGSIVLGTGVRITQGGGTATYDGTLIGGTLAVGGSTTLDNAVVALAAIAMGSTGTLVLASNESFASDDMIANGSLVLGGHALTLTGDSTQTGGQIFGPGTIAVTSGTLNLSGSIIVRGAGALVIDSGLINDASGLALSNASGDSVTLEVTAAGTYDILNERTLSSYSNAGTTYGTIINQGLLEKTTAVFGLRATEGAMLVNTGTLLEAVGTLLLSGTGNQLGGTLEGAGEILIGGTATLEPGVVIGAGSAIMTLAVGYGGLLVLGGTGNNYAPFADFDGSSNSVLALAGNTLTLEGQGGLDGTVLGGGGTMTIAGAYTLDAFTASGGTLTLFDAGFITDSGGINLGSAPTDHVGFQINPGAVYDIIASGAGDMYTYNNGATLDALVLNGGVFEDTAGGGVSYGIGPLFSNNSTGTIFVSVGSTLNFSQGLVNDGIGTVDGVMILNGSTSAGGLQSSTAISAPWTSAVSARCRSPGR